MDNLQITNPSLLQKSYNFTFNLIELINDKIISKSKKKNQNILINVKTFKSKFDNIKIFSLTKCEPFLSKRNLYRNVSKNYLTDKELIMFNLLYYGDGNNISSIAKILSENSAKVFKIAKILEQNKLVKLKYS